MLQGFCIYLIVRYSKYHHAAFSKTALEITGTINSKYNKVQNYFELEKTNNDLVKANENLLNAQKQNFEQADTANKTGEPPLFTDTITANRKWFYRWAKVVQQSIISQNNFVIIHRGSNQGVAEDMGVIDINNGVVGKITEVGNNYAAVMSLLHKDSKVSARLLKSPDVAGTITWNGKKINIVELNGIPKTIKVQKGDTVVTTGLTATFPQGYIIGTVDEAVQDKGSTNYLIKVKTLVNFYTVQMVYAIENAQKKEIDELENKLKKKTQ